MTALDGHLDLLEGESIFIFREAVAQARKPVLLYSIGKDSTVLLHLARKAFWPSPPPFPLLHIDTTWKFPEMIAFRDETARRFNLTLIVHTNTSSEAQSVSPFVETPSVYTRLAKTDALKQALDTHGFDVAFGGARRDEEQSRAKERIFSVRGPGHTWDPRRQRPELWHLLDGRIGRNESLRVFPLSNWTERDVWRYILRERLDIVPLYFAAERPTFENEGQIFVVGDARLPTAFAANIRQRSVRFRTLGCWPLTAAVPSTAADIDSVVAETFAARRSERHGRVIDHDATGAMERKKQEGYF